MPRFWTLVILFALAAPASALNSRSAVSVNGLDTNPCTPASPCRSFAAAILQTSPGGEIVALDSAGYGAAALSTGMMISGAPGAHAAITVTSGDAISINAAATDIVTLRNLIMIGSGTGAHGVSSQVSGEVRILNCYIMGFALNGITNEGGRQTIDHCVVVNCGTANGDSGINQNSDNAEGQAVVTNTLIEDCPNGILVFATANGNASASVMNCTIVGSTYDAVDAVSNYQKGETARLIVENSMLAYSTVGASANNGESLNGDTAIVYLSQDLIDYCSVGANPYGGGVVKSYGNNRFAEVGSVGTLSLVSLQ